MTRFLACSLLIALTLPPSYGQSTFGSIVGTAADESGAPVTGVALKVTNLDDNSSRVILSDNGTFQALNLKPGTYQIAASKSGFAETQTGKLTLDARQQLRVDIKLQVAAV